jgi:type I restriction enzyme S subunit
MEKYPAYKKYKLTRCAWLPEIPEHWEIKKLKFICKINQHSLEETANKSLNITYVDIGSVSFEEGIKNTENFITMANLILNFSWLR